MVEQSQLAQQSEAGLKDQGEHKPFLIITPGKDVCFFAFGLGPNTAHCPSLIAEQYGPSARLGCTCLRGRSKKDAS